jgi:DNA-binding response OmpR family regulator/curved DNA-binding protein CbpA
MRQLPVERRPGTTFQVSTILLVEDDRQLQHLLAEALHSSGFTVLAEHDGDWALSTFLQRPVDLLVCDGLLPRKNGFQLVQDVRRSEKGKKLPIIFISGAYKASKSKKQLEELAGPVEWLDKPVEPSRLVALCRKALGGDEESDPGVRRRRRERARVEMRLKESLADLAEVRSVESDSQTRFKGAALVRGNLSETTFVNVLSELHRWRATGALLLTSGPVKKLLWLREGAPHFIRSNLLAETLGQLLVRERMITVAECEASLVKSHESKRMQGMVLIEMGCISPANLSYALQLQLEQKLFDLFSWSEGDYRFNPRAQLPPSQFALELSPARVLLEGVKRSYDDERIVAAVAPLEASSVQLTDNPLDRFQDMGLDPEEAHFFSLVDGKRTAAELLTLGSMNGLPHGDGRRLLFALQAANMIHFGPAVSQQPQQPPLRREQPPPIADLPERALAEPELLQRQQVERLAARAQDLRRGTLFEVLSVRPDASEFEVRNAFAALARENHPDRLGPDASGEARAFAEDIFQQLSLAHDTLVDRGRRAEYELQLKKGIQRSDGEEVARILAAEQRFREGEQLLQESRFGGARAAFEEATQLYPDEAEFHACLGWAAWLSSGSAAQARAPLERALQLNPRIDRAYVFRGHIAKALGNAREAEAEFEKALLCNPACAEALRELRLARKP